MYIYAVLLAIGILGIVGMAVGGFVHIGAHHGGPVSHAGSGHALHVTTHGASGHSAAGHAAPAHGTAGHGHHAAGAHHPFSLRSLFSISPLDVFSYCAGAGMAAFLFRPYLAQALLWIPAILGALFFDIFVTRMIMSTIIKAAAKPSSGLEGTVAAEGVAETNFDSEGRGLVKLTLDGQIVQLLATLEPTEIQRGVRVRRGDSVVIVEVDSLKNRCKVTRELAEPPEEPNVLKLEGKK